MSGAERAEPLMEKTYIIQRRYLNSVPAPAIAVVKQEWPFLFSPRGICSHFTLLTDVSILVKFREALENKFNTILKFCKEVNCHQGVKDVLACFEPESSDKATCILLLLMAYFKEPTDAIVLDVDPCATATDVEGTVMLPSTPRLIVQGDKMKPRAWMLSLEGQVVMGPHLDFTTGLAAIFSSYYNFNLKYAEDAACTLEFIQRCFLGINPETGTKSKRQRGHMNQQVCTLIRKLIDFEWMSCQYNTAPHSGTDQEGKMPQEAYCSVRQWLVMKEEDITTKSLKRFRKYILDREKPSSDATPAAATSSSSRREPESERASLPVSPAAADTSHLSWSDDALDDFVLLDALVTFESQEEPLPISSTQPVSVGVPEQPPSSISVPATLEHLEQSPRSTSKKEKHRKQQKPTLSSLQASCESPKQQTLLLFS
ncbi:hypothetical protein F2P79_018093 [Pimephales promelas]|nr:hypothetical protein F2P79_018093 [Pimephales promelas]